jgi:hypothetical protein
LLDLLDFLEQLAKIVPIAQRYEVRVLAQMGDVGRVPEEAGLMGAFQ